MWLKILKYVVVGARMFGLDKKIKGWVAKRLSNVENRIKEVDLELDKTEE